MDILIGYIMKHVIDVEIGEQYFILNTEINYFASKKIIDGTQVSVFRKEDYENLKLYTLLDVYDRSPIVERYIVDNDKYRGWVNKVCRFINSDNHIDLNWVNLKGHIFKSKTDYLIELVKIQHLWSVIKHPNEVPFTITFDEFIKEKIRESQENNPEKWIF